MKYKYTLAIFALIVFALTFSVVYAQKPDITIRGNENIGINAQADANRNQNDQATSSARQATSAEVQGNTTSTAARNDNASTTANVQGQLMSETHRSVVATFVQSLLNVADREGGIGNQVREIAKAQNDSATTTVAAMAKVDARGPIRTFFFGSDYKNLGVIRNELATTNSNIARLKSLLDQTTNNADRAELNTQIQALEAEQTQVDAYVTAHENTFSLFGWFTKLFVK